MESFPSRLGHRLDNTYFVPKVEDLFKEFKKAIPELTVGEELRLKLENKRKQKKIDEIESDKDKRIFNLEAQMENINELLKRVTLS